MIIINHTKNVVVCFENIFEIFSMDSSNIKIRMADGETWTLAPYRTPILAGTAMEILCERIAKNPPVVFTPTEEEVKQRLATMAKASEVNSSHKSGIRHGGS